MAPTDRFEIIAPLPSSSGFRRALAVDRSGPPRAVVLAFAPARVADDPVRLAALARDAEAAARVRHPNVVPVDGLETVGGAVAVVEPHRPGPSLRDLLDAAGRLPPDVAARVVADACAGLARVHALDPGDGRPLAHGALSAERLVVAADGATVLTGLGAGLGEETAADVRALAAILHECLVGEPPQAPPRPLDAPGIPPALAAVVDLALGATGGQPLRSAGVLGEAIAAALPLAPREAVAAYAEAILPADEGERAALARLVARATGEDAEADLAVELLEDGEPAMVAATPTPTPTATANASPSPSPTAMATGNPVGTETPASSVNPLLPEQTAPPVQPVPTSTPVPAGPREAALPEWFAPAAAEARGGSVLPEPVVIPARVAPQAPAPAVAPAPVQVPRPADPFSPQPVASGGVAAPSPDTVSTFPAPVAAAPRRSRAPLAIAALCLLVGFGGGFVATRGRILPDLVRADVAGREPAQAAEARPETPAAGGAAPARPASTAPAEDAGAPPRAAAAEPAAAAPAKPAKKAPPRRVVAAAPSAGKGFLVVTAPAEAEVLVDGKRVGMGDVRREVDVGAHRVEVRLGGASVAERFSISRGETWTYDVTPTVK
ncbi:MULTISPECIES: PEGA domain-containing protein [unclassified Anaeromyxobacter]|uniref:PEGA domain-containing protein n=1 Tax=unclassified Anaeromyxobacter TaxID=2620896 RepID=UPI001F566587|nr:MULTISPECIES: PEGA domain-containing protein [unclassified Anaeromyxobacter]